MDAIRNLDMNCFSRAVGAKPDWSGIFFPMYKGQARGFQVEPGMYLRLKHSACSFNSIVRLFVYK